MTVWVWVVAYSVIGTVPEHGSFGLYSTRAECQQALNQRAQEIRARGKELAGTCFLTQRKT